MEWNEQQVLRHKVETSFINARTRGMKVFHRVRTVALKGVGLGEGMFVTFTRKEPVTIYVLLCFVEVD